MLGFSIAQIASIVQGEIEGDPSAMIYDFGKIETAKTGDITFLANLKYESCLYTTQASCILIAKEYHLKRAIKPNLIRVDNPYQALAKLLAEYQKLQARTLKGVHKKAIVLTKKTIPKSAYIGPGAVVEEGVEIGENVQIHALAYLGAGVKIGASSIIYPQVCVYAGCQIGARCIIHSGAVIGADGFGFSSNSDGSYTKIPQIGTVIIEEDVEIGANSTVDRATMGETRIRKGAKIDNLVQIGHNVEIGEYTVMAGQSGIAGSAKIGNRVMIAGQAGISGHLSIGDGAVLGPQSGISNRVKAGDKLLGSPAMPVNIYMKNMVHFRNLSQLIERIEKLEKHYNLSKEE